MPCTIWSTLPCIVSSSTNIYGDECRVLVLLLEVCGRVLAESRGMKTIEQLAALAETKLAIQSVDRG